MNVIHYTRKTIQSSEQLELCNQTVFNPEHLFSMKLLRIIFEYSSVKKVIGSYLTKILKLCAFLFAEHIFFFSVFLNHTSAELTAMF